MMMYNMMTLTYEGVNANRRVYLGSNLLLVTRTAMTQRMHERNCTLSAKNSSSTSTVVVRLVNETRT